MAILIMLLLLLLYFNYLLLFKFYYCVTVFDYFPNLNFFTILLRYFY